MSAAARFVALEHGESMVNLQRLLSATGYCRSAAYAAMKDKLLPRPVKVGRASRWPEHEVQAIAAAILRGDDEASRRALVRQLQARRDKPHLALV